jgi:hypothetical protein
MKVKIFRDEKITNIEKEINEWLSNNKIEIKFINQSPHTDTYRGNYGTDYYHMFVISIFYEVAE